MTLDRLTLSHFRNHAETRVDGTGHLNLLVGENGAGKTNVLEALSLFAPGRGLRRAPLAEIADSAGPGGFAVSATLDSVLRQAQDGRSRAEPVLLGTGKQPDRPQRRMVRINGAEASAMSLGEWLSVAWLTPAMDGLFTASAGERRRYTDRLALALEPAHARHASRYDAALRERNRLLAGDDEPDPRWLDSIEAQLAEAGTAVASGRAMLVERLSAELAAVPEGPFARPALALAAAGPRDAEGLVNAFARDRARDRAARRTLTGPHRDDLAVTMAGSGVPAARCSTGEQKALLIAIALAHAGLAAAGRPGVLLLDEVAAHLDPIRREALFERLRAGPAQVWLTGTERAPFDSILGDAATWRVSGGRAERIA